MIITTMRKIKPELVSIVDTFLSKDNVAKQAIADKDSRTLLMCAVKACIGEHEVGGNNKGTFVELCQETVDNSANGESWCMAFVQSMLAYVEAKLNIISPIYSSENCLEVWENTSDAQIVQNYPLPGAITIWRHTKSKDARKTKNPNGVGKRAFRYSGAGHTGFILLYDNDPQEPDMTTIEGNTSSDAPKTNSCDGVYEKKRNKIKEPSNSDLEVVGFLIPFKK